MPKSYLLELTPAAKADLQKIDKLKAQSIVKKLRWVAANVEDVNHTALTGQWAGYYRYRIGDYRAIYELDTDGHILLVAIIGHRCEVYDE